MTAGGGRVGLSLTQDSFVQRLFEQSDALACA